MKKNVLRTLVYDGEVSLTLADTTTMVERGSSLHALSRASKYAFGKALSLMTFMSACLKEESGEISLSVKGKGCGEIAVSGNRRLHVRGYILNTTAEGRGDEQSERALLGEDSFVTIIRDDGYNRPFVGACAFPENAGLDEGFEEYFRISEQLPTRLFTLVLLNETDGCEFSGVVAVQPLPFASEETLKKVRALDMSKILLKVKESGAMSALKTFFDVNNETLEERNAVYECNCSREYLTRVLVSLGETQMREIIKEDGAVRIHCHYCNTDYEFTAEDADKIFEGEDA